MKLNPSLKSLARAGLQFKFVLLSCLISGCYLSTEPTYLKEDIPAAIQDICKNEYNLEVKAKLMGRTLWVYLPVEDMFVEAKTPKKNVERFAVYYYSAGLENNLLKVVYAITNIPEPDSSQKKTSPEEKRTGSEFNKDVSDKINKVWKALSRVILSMERTGKNEPKFFCVVTADIKNGAETRDYFYYLDLKKVLYDFISWSEYLHRSVGITTVSLPEAVGDKEGAYVRYKDLTLEEFIALQIEHRIKLKFLKPEVEKTVDIDKEILKLAIHTITTYNPKEFRELELNNVFTQGKIILNRAAVFAGVTEKKP